MMTVEPRNIINSQYGLDVAYFIGRYTPSHLGHRIANFAADRISRRRGWKLVQAARLNQWVVHGENLSHQALDEMVRENFRSIARSIFDLYHNINNPAVFSRMIDMSPRAEQFLQRPEITERGIVVVGTHMSNFDFIGQAAAMAGVKAMYLALSKMNPHYQKQLEMRKEKGMNMVPTSQGTIKQAVRYLQQGGLVVTAIDRPDESLPHRPRFFNRPAALPFHHVFMALKAHVPIVVGSVLQNSDERYQLLFSDPVEMESHPDKKTEIILNTERILKIAEGFICQDPCQWAMTFPVWPAAMDQVP